jgi:hypothetical protein
VRWTNGGQVTFPGVMANQLVVIEEGKGIVSRQKFG